MTTSAFGRNAGVLRPIFLATLSLALPSLVPAPAFALEAIWQSSGPGVWSNGSNWLGGMAPTAGGAADFDLRFRPRGGQGFQSTNDLGPFVLRTLRLEAGRGFGLGSINFTGNQLVSASAFTFAAADSSVLQQGGGDIQVRAPFILQNNLELGGAGLGTLALIGPISGSGALRLDRANAGVTLLGNPDSGSGFTFSGGVDLISGRLLLDEASALGTGALRASGGFFGVNYYAGPRNFALSNPITLSNSVSLAGAAGFTFNGPISGSGQFTIEPTAFGQPPAQIRFQSSASFTGDLVVRVAPAGLTSFTGNAGGFPLASSISVQRGATLEVDDRTSASSIDRLPNAAPLAITGGSTLIYRSGNGRASVENFGAFRPGGWAQVSLNPGSVDAASSALLIASSWEPAAGAVASFSGRNLGQNAPGTAGSDNFLVANAAPVLATLRGAGGAASSATASILPQAVAEFSSFNNYTFATYDPVSGLRSAGHVAALTSGTSTLNNVRLSDPVVLNEATGINALALDVIFGPSTPRIGSVSGPGTLTVASGVVLMGPRASQISVGTLDLGAAGGLIMTSTFQASPVGSPSPATISSRILSSGGLTIAGLGSITLSGNNQIDGTLVIAAPVTVSSAAALGGSGPLEIQGGSIFAGFDFARDVIVTSGGGSFGANRFTGTLRGSGYLGLGGTLAGTTAFTGPTTLAFRSLSIQNSAAVGPATLQAQTNPFGGDATLQVSAPLTLSQPLEVDNPGTLAGTLTILATSPLTAPGLTATNGGLGPSSNLIKQGPAAVTIDGDLNLRGSINVQGGALYVHGQVAAPGSAASAAFTVQAGAVFGGSALVFRDVTLAGSLRPGNAGAGRLRIEGGLQALSGAGYQWERSVGASDLLEVAGTLTFSGGTFQLQLRALDAALPSGFDLLVRTENGFAGAFPTFVLDYTEAPGWAGLDLSVQRIGNDLYLVPEPSTWALLLAAGAGLALRRRRR